MPPADQFEENRVLDAIELLRKNPGMSIAHAVRETRALYDRVRRRLKGIPRSSSRGGHNKKLNVPSTAALKEFLLMCHALGKPANIDNVIAGANSILRLNGEEGTAHRRWAKNWVQRERDFIKTIRSTPLSWKRRAAHQKDEIMAHFNDFKRCKTKWGVLDEDVYNFDETGCMIGVIAGSWVIVPSDTKVSYVDDPDNRELVTSTECFSAGGFHVPPMLTFKGAYHLRKYFQNEIDGDVLFSRSESGFVSDKLTYEWLKHFDRFTVNRTKGRYRLLVFDGYGSHITQEFIDYCWEHRIRPYQLPPHSTHLTQPADVGAFQKLKHEFKKCLREEVFFGATEITKADFFALFPIFSARTFTPKLCIGAFKKTGLIPWNPSVVLNKMKEYGGVQEAPLIESSDNESEGFATPPLPDWAEWKTPKTNTGRRRGQEYVTKRLKEGEITPTVIRVQEKVVKASDTMVLAGALSIEYLKATQAREKARKARNDQPNKIVQKYGEIYGSQARRQIAADEEDERRVVNMREERVKKREEAERVRVEKAAAKALKGKP